LMNNIIKEENAYGFREKLQKHISFFIISALYTANEFQLFFSRFGAKFLAYLKGFPGGSDVKNLPAMQVTQEIGVRSLG
ncbi:hypothetical protein, partial [Klebsiella pneumoniae]|uniref:hypothetical protein n=1 Tax=Klebsiella pneumoniae TaxID=573 RepID=UPI00272F17F6